MITQKLCSKCEIEKPVSEFVKHKSSKDGLNPDCRACVSEYNKKYYQNNKEKIITQNKEYNKRNRDKIIKRYKNYYETNKDQILKHNKEYYQNNKDVILNNQKLYYEQNKEGVAKKQQNYYENNKARILKYHQDYYQKNKEKIRTYQKKWEKANKRKVIEFRKTYYEINKKEIRNRIDEWRKNNPDRVRKNGRKQNHQYRARKRNATVENFDPIEVFERDSYICQLCGCKTSLRYKSQYHLKRSELDHITPLSVGGAHSKQNTQCLCRQCNMNKQNKTDFGDQLRLFE